jgi:hypothetical protein
VKRFAPRDSICRRPWDGRQMGSRPVLSSRALAVAGRIIRSLRSVSSCTGVPPQSAAYAGSGPDSWVAPVMPTWRPRAFK